MSNQTTSSDLQEHIDLVKTHSALFARAISKLKYTASDISKALTAENIPVSTSLLKKALVGEKLIVTLN